MVLILTLKTHACLKQTTMNLALGKLPVQIYKALTKSFSIIFSQSTSQRTSVSPIYHGGVDKWLPILFGSPQTTYKPETTGLVHPFTTEFILQHTTFSPKPC